MGEKDEFENGIVKGHEQGSKGRKKVEKKNTKKEEMGRNRYERGMWNAQAYRERVSSMPRVV